MTSTRDWHETYLIDQQPSAYYTTSLESGYFICSKGLLLVLPLLVKFEYPTPELSFGQ